MRQNPVISFIVCVLVVLAGCSTVPEAEDAKPAQSAVLTFTPDRYTEVFAATVETLRDQGFRIARADDRFGTITTYPKESPTHAEFWIDDASTSKQANADTLNGQQRKVKINIDRTPNTEALGAALSEPADTDGDGNIDTDDGPPLFIYTLRIEVTVERLQQPARYLTHSASGSLTSSYDGTPAHLRFRGIDGPYTVALGRDAMLERRLVEAIRLAVIDLKSKPAPASEQIPLELSPQEKAGYLLYLVRERERIVNENPGILKNQIELATAWLTLASFDPFTQTQREDDDELVQSVRFQRERHFDDLRNLLNRMAEQFPESRAVLDLQRRALEAYTRFEKAYPQP